LVWNRLVILEILFLIFADNGLSFYFKINGIPMFMKGSNWIPAHILPEHSADLKKGKKLLQ
jgi:beta-mannosidase